MIDSWAIYVLRINFAKIGSYLLIIDIKGHSKIFVYKNRFIQMEHTQTFGNLVTVQSPLGEPCHMLHPHHRHVSSNPQALELKFVVLETHP